MPRRILVGAVGWGFRHQARFPDMPAQGADNALCLAHANAARRLLITDCPSWQDVTSGLLAAPSAIAGLGDWPHGWHFHASRNRNFYYRSRVLLPTLPPDHRALLRSQSGPHAGSWLAAIPKGAASRQKPCKSRFGDGCACPSQ